LGVDLGQVPGHEWDWPLTRVNIRTKVVIIIVLKPNSRVDPGHMLGGSTWVDLGQHKIKVIIIIVLKLYLGVNPG
jgi:hypothetical protein